MLHGSQTHSGPSLSRTTRASLLAALRDPAAHAAWHEFHARYRGLIEGFARRQGLSEADCEDVVQTVLMSLVRTMPRFSYDPARGRFRGYLKTIVLHEIFRITRRRRGVRSLEDVDDAGVAAPDARIDDDWEHEWREHHMGRALRRIAREFSEVNVSAFRMHAVHGYDVQRTAQHLGISTHQVYKARSRIVARLVELIETQIEADG